MKQSVLILAAFITLLAFQSAVTVTGPVTKAQLGKLLFFDPILSRDTTISCGSCHKFIYAFSDTMPVSTGVQGKKGVRNTPTVMNVMLRQPFFWDGRAKTLEEQALLPIENSIEMNLPVDEAVRRLAESPIYRQYFEEIYHSIPTRTNLAQALAAFERTLETSNSPFDQWQMTGDSTLVSKAARRGFILFNTKGNCNSCHFGSDFTTNEFRNIGLFNSRDLNDSGRSQISKNKEDVGKFKIPTLRNVSLTAPYMHNGMFRSLREVIEFYDAPDKVVPHAINRDSLLAKPLGLTRNEKEDLEAFLLTLTDDQFMGKEK